MIAIFAEIAPAHNTGGEGRLQFDMVLIAEAAEIRRPFDGRQIVPRDPEMPSLFTFPPSPVNSSSVPYFVSTGVE